MTHRRISMRGKLGRLLIGMSLMGVLQAVPLAGAVFAGEVCNTAGRWYTTISNVSAPHFLTHARGAVIPAGASFTSTYALTEQGQLTAAVSGTVTGSSEAGAVIAKASLTVGVTLSASGTKTTTQTQSYTWNFPGSSVTTRWVIYETVKKWNGKYQSRFCQANYQYTPWESGTWVSFKTQYNMAFNCATLADQQYELIAKPHCP